MQPDPAIGRWDGDLDQFDPQALRRALGCFATGVTVVTALGADGRKVGLTASSFNSVSMEPPLILWSLSRRSPSLDTFRDGSHFAVNVLSGEQEELCRRFGRSQPDKFDGIATTPGAGGAPLLPGAVAQFECAREAVYPGGDHLILVGRVLRYRWSGRNPLLFCQGRLSAVPGLEPALAG